MVMYDTIAASTFAVKLQENWFRICRVCWSMKCTNCSTFINVKKTNKQEWTLDQSTYGRP